jgi:hypothetical protein
LKNSKFCRITPCSHLKIKQHLEGTCRFHLQRRRISQEWNQHEISLLVTCFILVSCLDYSSTLKMEATCSPETSVNCQRTTRCYIPEDRTLYNHSCDNPTSYMFLVSNLFCLFFSFEDANNILIVK